MAITAESRVRITASGVVGRVTRVEGEAAVVLVPYQGGAVEVAETHALSVLEEIES